MKPVFRKELHNICSKLLERCIVEAIDGDEHASGSRPKPWQHCTYTGPPARASGLLWQRAFSMSATAMANP